MGGLGARTLLIAAGAVSMGIGAGFERSLQDAWKTAALPQSIAVAMPAPVSHRAVAPHAVASKTSVVPQSTQAPIRTDAAPVIVASVQPRPKAREVQQRDSFVVNATAVASAPPIAAAKGDKPTDVAPDVSDVQRAPIDAVAVQAPQTPTPAPTSTPSPTPTPQPKKRWIHRQLDHLNPFKSPNRASTPGPANPQGL